jgi:TonB family protein
VSRVGVAAAVVLMLAGCAHPEASAPKGPPQWLTAADYFNVVKKEVMPHWDAAALLRQRDPTGSLYGERSRSTLVSVTLGPDGMLRDVQVTQSSGVDFLDAEAVLAFKKSEPLPPPPAGLLTDNVLKFEFEFSMESASGRQP